MPLWALEAPTRTRHFRPPAPPCQRPLLVPRPLRISVSFAQDSALVACNHGATSTNTHIDMKGDAADGEAKAKPAAKHATFADADKIIDGSTHDSDEESKASFEVCVAWRTGAPT